MNQSHMNIPQDREQRIRIIFDKLKEKRVPEELHEQIGGWLLSEDNREKKEEYLSALFDDTFDYERVPRKRAYTMLAEFMQRVGMETEVRPLRRSLHRRLIFKVAAVLIPVLVIGGGLLLLTGSPERAADPGAQIAASVTVRGEGQTITLPDQSTVLIDAGSEIQYAPDFDAERSVTLNGKANFNVTKARSETDRFTVRTEFFTVTVYGTEFSISAKAGEESSTVELYHGSIRVDAGEQSMLMSPGEHLDYNHATAAIKLQKIAAADRRYDGMPSLANSGGSLAEIFRIIEEEYHVPVTVTGDLPEEDIRADLSQVKSLDELMGILEKLSGQFTYRITETEIQVTTNL